MALLRRSRLAELKASIGDLVWEAGDPVYIPPPITTKEEEEDARLLKGLKARRCMRLKAEWRGTQDGLEYPVCTPFALEADDMQWTMERTGGFGPVVQVEGGVSLGDNPEEVASSLRTLGFPMTPRRAIEVGFEISRSVSIVETTGFVHQVIEGADEMGLVPYEEAWRRRYMPLLRKYTGEKLPPTNFSFDEHPYPGPRMMEETRKALWLYCCVCESPLYQGVCAFECQGFSSDVMRLT